MRRLVATAFAILALGAGCGATADEDVQPPALTGAQVAREFRAETGRTLRRAAGTDPAWEQLSFGLDPPTALLRRYGIFSIYVVAEGNEEAVDSLLRDKATGKQLEPDQRDTRWERDSQSGTWVAYTRYGANVVLAWFSERRRPRTDARWERLDKVLSGLAA